MHGVPTQDDQSGARPVFCSQCSSKGKYSKLKFSHISLSSGIWICTDIKCNFPLNSEKLEQWIDTIDVLDERKSKPRKKSPRRSKDLHDTPIKAKRTKENRINQLISASETCFLQQSKSGAMTLGKMNANSVTPDGGMKILTDKKRFQRANESTKSDCTKTTSSHCAEFLYSLKKSPNPSHEIEENQPTAMSKKPSSEMKLNFGTTELDKDCKSYKLLQKYAPFKVKRSKNELENAETEPGFTVLESEVIDMERRVIEKCNKIDDYEDLYESDSAYSSPSTAGHSVQDNLLSVLSSHNSPYIDSALQMFDSLLNDDSKLEQIDPLDKELFCNDIFCDEIDLSKLC